MASQIGDVALRTVQYDQEPTGLAVEAGECPVRCRLQSTAINPAPGGIASFENANFDRALISPERPSIWAAENRGSSRDKSTIGCPCSRSLAAGKLIPQRDSFGPRMDSRSSNLFDFNQRQSHKPLSDAYLGKWYCTELLWMPDSDSCKEGATMSPPGDQFPAQGIRALLKKSL